MRSKYRFLSFAVLICLPVWILIVWILGYSFYRIHYQVGFFAPNRWRSQPDWVDVQFVVHDTLHFLRKQVYTGQQKKTDLPQFDLHLSRDDYQLLTRTDHSFRSQYVRTQLTYGGQSYNVRVRNRGGHFWHYNYPKKSWRIKLLGEEQIEGYRDFDLIAPKAYPLWEPLLDSWAAKAGVATFGTRLASLKFNNSDNGLVYFTPNLNDSLLERNGLGPGAVFGVDPEVMQFLPQRQYISAAWEDGYKWLVLHESRANVSRRALAELIQDLKLHPREFDKKYYGKGILDGFIRQLAFNSYLGIFHTSATANVKVHWDEKTGFFTPIAWDYLWPSPFYYLYWAGHPIFAKLLTSPRFAGDLADRMHWLYQTALPPRWIRPELDRYFRHQVAAFDQLDAHLLREKRVLEIGRVNRKPCFAISIPVTAKSG